MKKPITVTAIVKAPIELVWNVWTEPKHITKWNAASDDWHTPHATNELRVGGIFTSRMEAIDGSEGFDFSGKYTHVEENRMLAYEMEDGRRVRIEFESENNGDTKVTETFDAEEENPMDMQQQGWQSILNNFKSYCESIQQA
jgi:uncharacterized protein YndB with AHSA1/START domain